ncbi:hypothetical protein C8Q75DRAFT_756709 [Abortiporus biennis]|nr:hypothetical protein C8Q75DRAFT_756709 [Abortiporus biennis]
MQERYTLLKDLQTLGTKIDELKNAKSGKKVSEIRRIERSIQYAERKREDIKARRDALESTLKAFREKHGISADYVNRTYLNAGPVTNGID